MTLDEKLEALRAAMQQDISSRGLAGEMFSACSGDLAAACKDIGFHPAPTVGILTGFFIPGPDRPETDGPPGAAFLACVLERCRIPVVVLAEADCHAALAAAFIDAQLPSAAPAGLTHLVSIERVGPAADGRCYTMRGIDITERTSDVSSLFRGVRTIGIGDGGNEIGMGKLPREMIARNVPRGETIACCTATHHLLVAGISNWGAWALAVGVALARGVDPLISIDHERFILAAMIAEGGLIDGVTGKAEPSVDGVPYERYIEPLMEMLRIAEE